MTGEFWWFIRFKLTSRIHPDLFVPALDSLGLLRIAMLEVPFLPWDCDANLEEPNHVLLAIADPVVLVDIL